MSVSLDNIAEQMDEDLAALKDAYLHDLGAYVDSSIKGIAEITGIFANKE